MFLLFLCASAGKIVESWSTQAAQINLLSVQQTVTYTPQDSYTGFSPARFLGTSVSYITTSSGGQLAMGAIYTGTCGAVFFTSPSTSSVTISQAPPIVTNDQCTSLQPSGSMGSLSSSGYAVTPYANSTSILFSAPDTPFVKVCTTSASSQTSGAVFKYAPGSSPVFVAGVQSTGVSFTNLSYSCPSSGTTPPPSPNSYNNIIFGKSLAAVDVNGDGIEDILVGAVAQYKGGLYDLDTAGTVLVSTNGGTSFCRLISTPSEQYGASSLGESISITDFDKNGIPDLVAGDPNSNLGKGSAYVYMNIKVTGIDASGNCITTQTLNRTQIYIPNVQSDQFGSAVTTGDFDNDGVPDVVVGATGLGDDGLGSVYIAFMNTDGTVKATQILFALTEGLVNGPPLNPGARLGRSLFAHDLNGDGYPELMIGAPKFPDSTPTGSVYVVYFVVPPPIAAPVLPPAELSTTITVKSSVDTCDTFDASTTSTAILKYCAGCTVTNGPECSIATSKRQQQRLLKQTPVLTPVTPDVVTFSVFGTGAEVANLISAIRNGSLEFVGISRYSTIVAAFPSTGPFPVEGPQDVPISPIYTPSSSFVTTIGGPCRIGSSCASFCNGDALTYGGNNFTCNCLSCSPYSTSPNLTSTTIGSFSNFVSFDCSFLSSQDAINECSQTLAASVACYILQSDEDVSIIDQAAIAAATWYYRPATYGTSLVPQNAVFIDPSTLDCGSSSGSKKGLLGLLGLLGLIPLLLCCCLCLLCLIRRKRAGPEVPFATFDPHPSVVAPPPAQFGGSAVPVLDSSVICNSPPGLAF